MSKASNQIIIIFGATGDLAKRYLIPSLYQLTKKGKLNTNAPIVCVGRKIHTQKEFLDSLESDKFIKNLNPKIAKQFFKNIYYKTLDYSCSVCSNFKEYIDTIDKKYNCKGNKLFYLSTPPFTFKHIAELIKESGFLKSKGWQRIAIEKPFGKSLKSAKELNDFLSKRFKEEQIYRIDHYLGKSLIKDIMTFRFANPIFKHIWKTKYIDNVQITIAETLGVEKRAGYYETAGAIKDMLQNHILQVLAFIAMKEPKSLSADDIRNEKVNILNAIKRPKPQDVIAAQYTKNKDLLGYKQEEGVSKASKTETYIATKININTPQWKNTPFYVRTGKRLKKRFAEINLILRKDIQLFPNSKSNLINIRIQPNSGIAVVFNTQDPTNKMLPVTMDFCHNCMFALDKSEAYETLFEAMLKGDQTHFTRWDGAIASWKYADKVIELAKNKPLHTYKSGTIGPKAANTLIEKDKKAWVNDRFL